MIIFIITFEKHRCPYVDFCQENSDDINRNTPYKTDLRTEPIPQDLGVVDQQFGASLGMHAVEADLLKHHRPVFSRPVPVYDGVVC